LKTTIIAEIGINHNGSIKDLFKLIDSAKKAGADFVKIQTYIIEDVMKREISFAPYQKLNIKKKVKIFDLLKKYQISFRDHYKILKYCKKKKINFLSSPFDLSSAKFLCEELKLKIIKIPSGEITNYPLLKYLSMKKVKIILSTGMSNLKEISNAINLLKVKKRNLVLLHCNTSYPTKFEDVNLLSMISIKKRFNCEIGFSDHTLGNQAAILACCLGAQWIEKHITLNNDSNGPDHKASLNVSEFVNFVKSIKDTKVILGSGIKKITNSEKINLRFARKSVYAYKNINEKDKFTNMNLVTLRPFVKGSEPMQMKRLYGQKAKRNYHKFDLIKFIK
jgi:N,N'-diacetyllegionaminate synthase